MNWYKARRAMAALGISLATVMAAALQPSVAQTGPRSLPANPQNQAPPDYRPDRQFDRQDNGRGYDTRGPRAGDRGENRVERRLEFLHTQLRITPAQEPRWSAFVAAVRDEAGDNIRRTGDGRRGAPSVIDRLEQRERALADRGSRVEHILNTLRPLYASFNDDQKRTADRLMFQADGGRFAGRGGFRGGRGEPDLDRGGRFDSRARDNRDDRGYR